MDPDARAQGHPAGTDLSHGRHAARPHRQQMSESTDDRPPRYRRGVGIMLLNALNRVFVAQRVDFSSDAWQMPQGGIDKGETPREAARRELKEETGTDKADRKSTRLNSSHPSIS